MSRAKKKPRLKHSLDDDPSCVYLKSKAPRIELKRNSENQGPSASLGSDPGLSTASMSSDRSKEWGIGFKGKSGSRTKENPRLKHRPDNDPGVSKDLSNVFQRHPLNHGPLAISGSDSDLSSVSARSDCSKEWGIEFQRDSENPSPFASLGSDPGLRPGDDPSRVSLSRGVSKYLSDVFQRDSENPSPFASLGSDPGLSSVSVSSDRSKEWGIGFERREIVQYGSRTRGTSINLKSRPGDDPNCVSKDLSNVFQRDSENPSPFASLGLYPGLSSVSVSSDRSKEWGIGFKRDSLNHGPFTISGSDRGVSSVSVRSDRSKEWGIEFQRCLSCLSRN